MLLKFVFLSTLWVISTAKDDKKWVWENNNRDGTSGRFNIDREERYEVYENEGPFRPSQPLYERPYDRPDINHINRPGGVYGGLTPDQPFSPSNYGQNHPHYPPNSPEVLTGPIPSWVKEGPFKNYDKCKCTEKFNCQSPGISYGHCDVGKQYCCYATKKSDQLGGPFPSRPQHSIENGILVGPGGPVDVPRPGNFRPGFGIGGPGRGEYRPGPVSRPVYSAENGVLVGPGGPFDRPGGARPGGFGFGRSN